MIGAAVALRSIQLEAQSFCRSVGLSEELTVLERAWESEMGGLSSLARLVALERRSVVVEVDSSVALQELSLRRRELIRRLNSHFPSPFVRNMTVRMAQHGS